MDNKFYLSNILPAGHDASENILLQPLYKIFVWFFYFSLVILVCFDWIEHYYSIELIAKPVTRAFLFLIFIFVIFFSGNWKKGKRFFLAFPLIVLGYLFVTYAIIADDMLSGIYYSSKIVFWIAGTFFVYRMLCVNLMNHNYVNNIIYINIFIYTVMIFFFMFNPKINFSQNLSVYALLWFIPILLLAKNSFFRNIFLIMAFFAILISFKRGAMLALILSSFSYLTVYFWINTSFKNLIKIVFLMLSVIVLFSISLAVVHEARPDFFERRVADIVDTDKAIGSGRGEFFPFLLNNYISAFHSSPINFFLGFGSRSVEKKLTGGYYAHSDWLQLVYDYGLLGFFVLVWIHISILRLIFKGIKQKFIFVPALAMNYTIFFLLNIYSGILFFPNTIYFGIFLSLYYYLWLTRNYNPEHLEKSGKR